MNRIFMVFGLICQTAWLSAQVKGPHGEHLEMFRQPDSASYAQHARLVELAKRNISRNCLPFLEIYGWHPAWSAGAYKRYDFPLLNTLSWFAYEVDPASGSYRTTHGWEQTGAVQLAHDGGSQVDLTVFLDGEKDIAKLLSKKKNLLTLRDSVVSLLDRRDADGVCLDFEGLSPTNGDEFTELARLFSDTLHKHLPRRKLTITLPFKGSTEIYPIKLLIPLSDRFVLKAYGMYRDVLITQKAIESAVDGLLAAGMPPSKLLLGIPYFGYASSKDSDTAIGKLLMARYFDIESQGLTEDIEDIFPIWRDAQGQFRWQGENEKSLSARIQISEHKGLAGIAVWGLGYDHGPSDFWSFLKKNTADCSAEETHNSPSQNSYEDFPGSGLTSAERNEYHWIWMLCGGAVAIGIMLIVRRLMK